MMGFPAGGLHAGSGSHDVAQYCVDDDNGRTSGTTQALGALVVPRPGLCYRTLERRRALSPL